MLGGIRNVVDQPKAIFVVDSKREEIAIKEATSSRHSY
jgi:ribosomal protein S2